MSVHMHVDEDAYIVSELINETVLDRARMVDGLNWMLIKFKTEGTGNLSSRVGERGVDAEKPIC